MNTYLRDRGAHTEGAALALRFPIPRFIVDGLTIEKRVIVRLQYHSAAAQPLSINWDPQGAGPIPSFSGTLAATPESEATCRLTIAGSYTPPGGIAGVVFDQLIGGRIAAATLEALLGRFTQAIESEYNARLVP